MSERALTLDASTPRAGAGPRGVLARLWTAPAWALTAALAVPYVILAPASADLAAAGYRSELFSRVGLTLWDNAWYGGHHLIAYSLFAPALGALLGPQLLAAVSMTIATALFAALIEGRFPARASRLAALWFALGAAVGLLANRVPFDLGLALGLGALLAFTSGRSRALRLGLAPALALACSLASPVAGAFLALAALASAIAAARSCPWPQARETVVGALALGLAAAAPIALLALAFPEGGTQPFVPSAFYPALAGVLVIAALIGPTHPALRTGALLYAAALVAAYLIPSAVGGNVDRLGALLAGPIAACVLVGASASWARSAAGGDRSSRWRPRALLVLAPALLYWQSNAAVADFTAALSDPAVHASYYAPLLDQLRALGVGSGARPVRLEAVPTRNHYEARYLAPSVMLARGWERQLDRERNALFYAESPGLTPARYRAWLLASAVSYVALPDAALDYSARGEARVVRQGAAAAGLREAWHAAHWRLYEVLGSQPLVEQPARLEAVGSDSFTLTAPAAGRFVVRLRFTPYWTLASGHGCVARAGGDWTLVQTPTAGSFRVVIGFSLARVFDHGPRCR